MKTVKVAKLPVPAHIFVGNGVRNHWGVEGCTQCPLLADRLDVHTVPGLDEAQQVSERIVGEAGEGE